MHTNNQTEVQSGPKHTTIQESATATNHWVGSVCSNVASCIFKTIEESPESEYQLNQDVDINWMLKNTAKHHLEHIVRFMMNLIQPIL